MKKMNLREANQQFSQLVRHVQETGETIEILRRGEPAAELRPSSRRSSVRELTPQQRAALESMLATARRAKKSTGRKLTRDEMHER